MVTLINYFTVQGDSAEFERVFEASSEFMVNQPGFISHRLVKSINKPGCYVNIALWESAEAHMNVVRSEGFARHLKELAEVATASPDLYSDVLTRGVAGA